MLNFKNNTGYTKRLTEKAAAAAAATTQPATSTTQAQKQSEEVCLNSSPFVVFTRNFF